MQQHLQQIQKPPLQTSSFHWQERSMTSDPNHLERFFDLSLELLCLIDFQGVLKSLNPAWKTILGYSPEELYDRKFLDFIHPQDQQRTRLGLKQLILGQPSLYVENRCCSQDGSYRWIGWTAVAYPDEGLVYAVGRDMTHHKQVEAELHSRLQQQAAVSELSQKALTDRNLDTLMQKAVELVRQTLSVDCSAILELLPNHQALFLRAGVGWQAELVGQATLSARSNCHAGYTLSQGKPVIVEDLRVETRFSGSPLLHNHRLVSGIGAIISDLPGSEGPFGVLSVYARESRKFTQDDVSFLQTIANVLTSVMTRLQAQEQLHLMERAIASSNNGMIITDATRSDNPIVYVNPAFEEITGYSLKEVVGHNCRFLQGSYQNQTALGEIREAIEQARECHVVLQNVRKDGQLFWNELHISPVFNPQGHLTHFIGIQTDISDRKQAQAQLEHNAFYDHLTNLANRARFIEYLQQAIEQTQKDPHYQFAVLFLDLDGFKNINDSLGHLVGDLLLVAIARRLENCLRPRDLLARLGGDEFTIFLDNIHNLQDATKVAQRVLKKLSHPFNLNGHEVFANTSIGITLSTIGYDQPGDILRDADLAMYQAKTAGKGRYAVFNTLLHTQAVNRLKLETDLRGAIERQQLQVYYQPIIELATGQLTGFESLLRWQHPELGFVSPAEFIPIAEETGFILPIGTWVLEQACQQLHLWNLQFPDRRPLTMNVNLSVKQFAQPDLIEQIDRILEKTQIEGQCLKLEITESVIMDNSKVANLIFQQLKARQIRLCIDDFGTGYSSLSYLYRFPVHTLKIDRSFLTNLESKASSQYREIIQAVIDLGHNLGMDIVAEGIETIEQHKLLQQFSCEYGQGYFYSLPMPVEAITELLGSRLNLNPVLVSGD
ncbi:EAL domain-containing protein [Roseofilum sp. BLCC_M91]|uniref:EAL domain-containing protein n=1 Tax=Roseofilum halophilum BLCC-M91 TaxID=3022259 RepID=A0ABT7BPK0_9CYAN|nr:GGDEF domain-containing phosphodiesterase [Roseofilum halophilum]MDJ1181124.1 EAL domain-containing protein [Roseofilum halophilum BLCC-M91]